MTEATIIKIPTPLNLTDTENMQIVAEGIVRLIKAGVPHRVYVNGPPGCGKLYAYQQALERHQVAHGILRLPYFDSVTPNELREGLAQIFVRVKVLILDGIEGVPPHLSSELDDITAYFVEQGKSVIIFKTEV